MNDPTHLPALGVIQNSFAGAALYGSGTTLGLFDGLTPSTSDVLIKYTYFGDANLDGKVDASDYSRIDNGFVSQLTGWFNGDFNYDGIINGSDYTLIDNAFNRQVGSLAAAASPVALITTEAASPVPEPTGLLVLMGLSLVCQRRFRA
jgi:hypothetical protein